MAEDRSLPNWIEAYLMYTHSNEAPEEFHLWMALTTIAGVLRRNVSFDMGYFTVYPNLYTVLVSPPGRCKKSTAMRISREFLRKVDGINFTSDSISRERLIQDLSQCLKDDQSPMTAYSSEFASLLTTSGMDMVVFLTDIYDSPSEWSHKTKMGGTQKIIAPYLNLAGGTTPDWIARSLPLDTVGIGLTSRVLFVYQDTPRKRPPRPKLTPEQIKLGDLLTYDLRLISTISGEYKLDSEAEKVFDSWYEDRLDNPNTSGDPRLNGYFERKPVHVLKVAMIVAASRHSNLLITVDDLQLTWGLLERTEARMPKVFAAVGKNVLAFDLVQIVDAVAAGGPAGITERELMQRFVHNVRREEMAEILATLIQMGTVFVQQVSGKPSVVKLKQYDQPA
jgi:hypothetical protein